MFEYRKVKTGIKSSRVTPPSEPNLEIWSWLCELRESGKGKVYDINPYIEVYKFREDIYGMYSENADGLGDVWMYLIIGPEKAMLIDTSFGIGNLKALCDEITGGMELIVVNTHAHPDHAYGDCWFDKVYCHEYMKPYIEKQNSHIWDYLFNEDGSNKFLYFDKNDLPEFKPFEIVGCPDGYLFDLGGGHEIELIFLPGHQAGHAGYLDKKNRILFSGDGLCCDRVGIGGSLMPGQPFREYASVTKYREALLRLEKRMDEFDVIYPQHYIIEMDKSLIPLVIKTCDEIIADPLNWDFKISTHGFTGGVVYYNKIVKGTRGSVAWKEGCI